VIWRKLGLVHVADGSVSWARSHAAVPTALLLDEQRIRVYVAFVDAEQIGRVGYVDVDASDPLRVLEVSERPVLDIGAPGMFDDHGVNPLSVCEQDGQIRLYYAGWQLGVAVRYFLFLGLATSEDGGASFRRHSRVPVLDRSDAEPMLRSSAHVAPGRPWRMWYAGGERWTEAGDRPRPTYELRYLESDDGLHWGPEGRVCMSFADADEFGFSRPFVVEEADRLAMWYSIRTVSRGYRIGFAESRDGIQWERHDESAGISVSDAGWDSEMVCYPCVQRTRYGRYLFYNGNGYGRTGFGVAVAEET
jgi:hypothetical protein